MFGPYISTSQNSYHSTIFITTKLGFTPFPVPISESQEMNNKSVLLPGLSSSSQTNIPVTGDADSSAFEQCTPQAETLLSSSAKYDFEVGSTSSSSYQSPSSEEVTVKNIKRKLSMYKTMLDNKKAENNPECTKRKKPENLPDDVHSRQMLLRHAIDIIDNSFERAMHEGNMQGYAYGIILEDGSVISGSSPSLQKWWEETVRFDVNAPVAVNRYDMENQLNLDPKKDAKTPRRTYDILMELCDVTLGSLLSALMTCCDPPQRKFPLEKKVPPPWWPTGSEPWWDQITIEKDEGQPPYRKPHDLRKMWKAAVVIAIIKHMAPAFNKLARVVKQSKIIQCRMNVKEMKAWNSVLEEEAKMYSSGHPDLDVSLPDLMASFPTQGIVLSDNNISGCLNNHVEGFQSRFQHPTLLPEQKVPSLTPIQHQQHHQVASMLNLPTERRVIRYTCDHPWCLHHDEIFGFHTMELRDQHLWSCVFRNPGGQFRTPFGPSAFQTSTLYQGITSPQFTPMPQVPGAPSQYQQMDPLQFQPLTHQHPNPAYEEAMVPFSEIGSQQQNLSFRSFGSSDYSTIPNDGQDLGSLQSAFPGQGFFNGERSHGNAKYFQ